MIPSSPNIFILFFELYVCRKLKSFKLSILDKAVLICNIIIAIICADSKLYYLVCSDLACKCYHICGGTLTLSVRCLTLLSYSSQYSSSASSDMSYSSSVSQSSSESSNKSSSAYFLLLQKQFHVCLQFHVGSKICLVVV